MANPASSTQDAKFGRMFKGLPPAKFGKDDKENSDTLAALGRAMSADFDPPKAGVDNEESGIPALYTYFGQFIDHDITFDPASSLQKTNDPSGLTDFRTPAFDLDNVYGRGPGDQPYMYDGDKFLLGAPIHLGDPGAFDLPRNNPPPGSDARALIGDPRNDENSIVSQFQGLLLRFHNRILADRGVSFEEAQKEVRFHYQYVVMNDFLTRIVGNPVLEQLRSSGAYAPGKIKFFKWHHFPYLPVEFSVAAYRLGHSMVRPGYTLNDATLLPIFPAPDQGFPEGLTGFRPMNPSWGIDWARFIDLEVRANDGDELARKRRLQFAYRMDTSLANPLSMLPPSVVGDPPPSLAQRNLLRGWRMGLPSGQEVAKAMGVTPLKDEEILIGKAEDGATNPNILSVSPVFKDNCPLWTYVLAEAMHHAIKVTVPVAGPKVELTTPQLGPVGGRIVAEVFLGLWHADKSSLIHATNWSPTAGRKTNEPYQLKHFVAYALGR